MILYITCSITFFIGIYLSFQSSLSFEQPGSVFIWGSGLVLLLYGFVRDIFLLVKKHKEEAPPTQKKMALICFESTLGGLAVILGLTLQALDWTKLTSLSLGSICILVSLIVAGGHYTRDWVLVLVKVKNHHNLLPGWHIQTWDEKTQLPS